MTLVETFEFRLDEAAQSATLVLTGQIGSSCAPAIANGLETMRPLPAVVVDWTEAESISSAVLQVLLVFGKDRVSSCLEYSSTRASSQLSEHLAALGLNGAAYLPRVRA